LLAYLSLGEDESPPAGPGPLPSRYRDRQKYLMREGFPWRDDQGFPVIEPGQDGIPDRNGAWGGYFVNPADAEWRALLIERAGLLLSRGVDGFLLDTVDVSPELRPAMMDLVEGLSRRFPEAYWVANRGLDLWQAYPERFCGCLDGVVFESWFSIWDWHSGRGVLSPHRQQNQEIGRRWLASPKRPARFLLDYMDPHQPDRGVLLAERAEFERGSPAFWSHPFLNRLELPLQGSGKLTLTSPQPQPRWTASGLLELGLDQPCQVVALVGVEEFPLEGLHGPWAVGAAQALKVRRVEPDGTVSAWSRVELPQRGPAWSASWTAREREHCIEFAWKSPNKVENSTAPANKVENSTAPANKVENSTAPANKVANSTAPADKVANSTAQIWLGDEPGSLRPTSIQGATPLILPDLAQDRLYWVSLSHPGGIPDRVRPIRTHDVTPPPAPERVWGRFHGGYLTLSWSPVRASDLAGYRCYVSRTKAPLSLPYEVVQGSHLEVALPRQSYRVLVTSFDSGNHESQPGPVLNLP